MKVKVISLPYIFQVLYVLCFTRPRYQVSVYRTIGPLVPTKFGKNLSIFILPCNYCFSQTVLILFLLSRAVYCVIGQCDHTEDHTDIADKIDDYLWLKLSQVHFNTDDTNQEEFTLPKLQKLLYEDYGES